LKSFECHGVGVAVTYLLPEHCVFLLDLQSRSWRSATIFPLSLSLSLSLSFVSLCGLRALEMCLIGCLNPRVLEPLWNGLSI
jgi:hypothetical protein